MSKINKLFKVTNLGSGSVWLFLKDLWISNYISVLTSLPSRDYYSSSQANQQLKFYKKCLYCTQIMSCLEMTEIKLNTSEEIIWKKPGQCVCTHETGLVKTWNICSPSQLSPQWCLLSNCTHLIMLPTKDQAPPHLLSDGSNQHLTPRASHVASLSSHLPWT